MSSSLDISITILVWILIIFFIALGIMLTMCLIELRKTLQNCSEISKICKDETQPILGEFKNTLANVQKITSGANSNFNMIKGVFKGALGAGALMLSHLKSKNGGFIQGLISGFKLFKK